MKTALVTLRIMRDRWNIGWMEAGLPCKVKYAHRIGADFIDITEPRLRGSVAMEKYQIGGLLDRYDRIIYMDADLFIVPTAPSLFDVVPADCFGAYDEGRPALFAWLKEGWPDDPCEFYVNNGLFVCSREHKWLFDWQTLNRKLNTYEQTHMSRRIWEAMQAGKIKLHWLSQSWNYMPHLYIGGPAPGWIQNVVPDPIHVHHFPCHKPEERVAALNALNAKHRV